MSFANAIPQKRQRQWAHQMLEQVNLADRLTKFPHQLSMGEQQRVAVVRAVINKPKIILADEPTASLDHDNSLLVLDILRQFSGEFNSILLVSTHDRTIINQFKRICPLRRPDKGADKNAFFDSLA